MCTTVEHLCDSFSLYLSFLSLPTLLLLYIATLSKYQSHHHHHNQRHSNLLSCAEIRDDKEHGITPESVKKNISDILDNVFESRESKKAAYAADKAQEDYLADPAMFQKRIKALEEKMKSAAADLEFEEAARIRDEIRKLEAMDLGLTGTIGSPRLLKHR